jgi:hypothetical protein
MKKKKFKKIKKFIKNTTKDNKPLEQKKIVLPKVEMPPKWKMESPLETGFVFQDFELIVDAEEK